jgi:hypothetical protein
MSKVEIRKIQDKKNLLLISNFWLLIETKKNLSSSSSSIDIKLGLLEAGHLY